MPEEVQTETTYDVLFDVGGALYAAYCGVQGQIDPACFVEKVLRGVVFYDDLRLEHAFAACDTALGGGPGSGERAGDGVIRTRDVQELVDRLCSLTLEDPLTGLFNRRYFEHRLRQEARHALRSCRPLSVMMIDIDEFKKLNDRFGHQAGDLALCAVASAITGCLRLTDEAASRVGGEEFAVLMPDTDAHGIGAAAERVRAAVEATRAEGAPPVTVSIGTATFDPEMSQTSAVEILGRADRALYEAKRAGRNVVRSFGRPAKARRGVSLEERDALFE